MNENTPKASSHSAWRELSPNPTPHEFGSTEGLLTHISHRAMATDFVAILPNENPEQIEMTIDALEELNEIEAKLTVYQPDSEISQINRLGFQHPVSVSWMTFRLIERAIQWSKRTAGAFDISAGPLVEAWGFTKRQGRKPTNDEITAAKARVGYDKVVLDPAKQTIGLAQENMAINLGAIGKGFALDRIASLLHERGIKDFLLHGGNSSVIASGDQEIGSGNGWAVGLAHPTKTKHRIAGIWLRNRALGTSGSGKQFFHHRGKRYGHVIDPRSGLPAGDLQSLTTLAVSATDADACATGLYVAGSAQIQKWVDHEWFHPTIMIRGGSRQDLCELCSAGEIPWIKNPFDPSQ